MRVHWTATAQRHLRAIHAYIAQDSPEYAARTVDRLTRRSEQIGTFPWSGRSVPEYQTEHVREVFEGAYRIIYRVRAAEQIDVIAVIHGARHLSHE